MSINKNNVFLFGPEASVEWKAPSTSLLTDLILCKGFRKKDNTTITSLIYKKLKTQNNKRSITYESILGYIDDLYSYVSLKNQINSPGNRIKSEQGKEPYQIKNLDESINIFTEYEITDINDTAESYSMIIPGYNKQKEYNIPMQVSPDEKYFELLYSELAGIVIDSIGKYSYHTEGRDLIFKPGNEIINQIFINYFTKKQEDSAIRMYSLAYERIFKVLLFKAGVSVFEGFNVQESYVKYNETLQPDIQKITTDADCNCFYNLNGSAYWKVEKQKPNKELKHQYYLMAGTDKQHSTTTINIDNNKSIIASCILTNHQKTQRTTLSPFRQMLSSFERDCMSNKCIYLFGYKFNNQDINEILINTRKFNSEAYINLIDPDFDEKDDTIKFLMEWKSSKGYNYLKKIGWSDHIFSDDCNFVIHKKTFTGYLQMMKGGSPKPKQ